MVKETTLRKTFWLYRQPEKREKLTKPRKNLNHHKAKPKKQFTQRIPLPRTTEVMVSSGRVLRNEFSFTPLEEKCTAVEEKEMNVLEEQQPQFETVGPFCCCCCLPSGAMLTQGALQAREQTGLCEHWPTVPSSQTANLPSHVNGKHRHRVHRSPGMEGVRLLLHPPALWLSPIKTRTGWQGFDCSHVIPPDRKLKMYFLSSSYFFIHRYSHTSM